MRKNYIMKSLYIPDMGSTGDLVCTETAMETKEESALWTINNMRQHDGLKTLTLDKFLYEYGERGNHY